MNKKLILIIVLLAVSLLFILGCQETVGGKPVSEAQRVPLIERICSQLTESQCKQQSSRCELVQGPTYAKLCVEKTNSYPNGVEGCDQKKFTMGFILLTPNGVPVTGESLRELNLAKSEFAKDFNYATNGLATMDTSYPVQVIEIDVTNAHSTSENIKNFYMTNRDNFDFISIYGDNGITPTIAGGDHLLVKNKINGIGLRIFDDASYFGSSGKLKGVNSMHDLSKYEYSLDNKNSWSKALLHETGHQWCCSVGDNFVGDNGNYRLEIIQQGIHFYRGLESPYETGTPMNSDYWVANGDWTYHRNNYLLGVQKYHPFQLYFMGLLPKSEYSTKFKVYNAGGADSGTEFNFNSATLYKEVSVNDIIAIEGERTCAS